MPHSAPARAERRARTEVVRARRLRVVRAVDPSRAACTARELGTLRSTSILGCRRARCGVCHPEKRWKAKSLRVRRRVEARVAVTLRA